VRKPAATKLEYALPAGLPLDARIPQQVRSKQRFEKIVRAARALIAAHGVLRLRMHDVAAGARVPIGSVYQYFPTRSALIAFLFAVSLESYHELARQHLRTARNPRSCATALRRIVFEVYKANRADVLMQEIWSGVQADPRIRALHLWDNEVFTEYFYQAARRGGSPVPGRLLFNRCRLINELWDGTIRLSITLDPRVAQELIGESVAIGLRELGLTAA
jgi:AcrR family transcriptional regulator